MTQNNKSLEDNPFWDFSLKFYGQNNVASSCLILQETVNADVNILLYCCWAASEGAAIIKPAEFAEIIEVIAPWQSSVIRGLRQIRNDMKKKEILNFGEISEGLRQSIKLCEIEGERLEQSILYQSGQRIFRADSVKLQERIGNAKINLKNYIETISGNILESTDNLIQIISDDLDVAIDL